MGYVRTRGYFTSNRRKDLADWLKMKKEYLSGGVSFKVLAEKYGVPYQALCRVARNEGWSRLRRVAGSKADVKLIESIASKNAYFNERYVELIDKLFDKANVVIDGVPSWTPSTLKEMATAMKYLRDARGIKSDADAKEQEARIMKLLRELEGEGAAAQKISVMIEGAAAEYGE